MIKLYGKHLRVNKAAKDTKEQEWFANLFVGNLSLEVDEKMLYDTFSQFGAVLSAKIMSKPETPETRRFAFVTFDSFESSDAAIQAMNGQFLHNQAIHVSYAYKKDGSKGEKHGTPAERVLAKKQQQQFKVLRPPPLSSLSMMGRMSLPAIPMGLGALPPRPPPMGGNRGGGPGLGAPGAPRPPPPPVTGSGRGLMGSSNPSSTTTSLPPPETKTPSSTSSSSSSVSTSSSTSNSSNQTTTQPPPLPSQNTTSQQMINTPMGRGIPMPPLPPMGPLGRGLPPPPPPIAIGRGAVGMFPPPPPRPPMLPAFMMGRGMPMPGLGMSGPPRPPTT